MYVTIVGAAGNAADGRFRISPSTFRELFRPAIHHRDIVPVVSLHLDDVVFGFGKRRHLIAVFGDVTWPRVVSGQSEFDVAFVHAQQIAQKSRSGHDILLRIERVLTAVRRRRLGHKLHEAARPRMALCLRIKRALLFNDRVYERHGNAVLLARALHDVLKFIATLPARKWRYGALELQSSGLIRTGGHDLSRGSRSIGASQRRPMRPWRRLRRDVRGILRQL